jgi:hypothetical protein
VSGTDNRIITALLLSLVAAIISVGFALTYMVVRWRHRQADRRADSLRREHRWADGDASWLPGKPRSNRPVTWMAVRTMNLAAVQRALELDDPQPCAWTDGLAADAARRLYISPPIAGWVLVTGADLPEPSDDVDACFRFLARLSRRLGHVQFFHLDHALQHHAWARLEAGRVLRAYAWIGQTVWNQGSPTAAECELGLHAYAYGEGENTEGFGSPDAVFANIERLPRLAARWSLDPAAVDVRFWAEHPGLSGESSVPRLL